MDNNSNTLLGWEAVADALSSETLNNPLVTGTFSTGNDDISDDEIKRLQRTNRGPSVKEVFGIDTSKEEKDTEVEETEETVKESEDDIERNTTVMKATKIRWTGKTGIAGKYYYDNDKHTLYDLDDWLKENGTDEF